MDAKQYCCDNIHCVGGEMPEPGAKGLPEPAAKRLFDEKVSMTFECSSPLAKAVEDEAKARNVSISAVLRMALEHMLGPRLHYGNDDAYLHNADDENKSD